MLPFQPLAARLLVLVIFVSLKSPCDGLARSSHPPTSTTLETTTETDSTMTTDGLETTETTEGDSESTTTFSGRFIHRVERMEMVTTEVTTDVPKEIETTASSAASSLVQETVSSTQPDTMTQNNTENSTEPAKDLMNVDMNITLMANNSSPKMMVQEISLKADVALTQSNGFGDQMSNDDNDDSYGLNDQDLTNDTNTKRPFDPSVDALAHINVPWCIKSLCDTAINYRVCKRCLLFFIYFGQCPKPPEDLLEFKRECPDLLDCYHGCQTSKDVKAVDDILKPLKKDFQIY